MPRILVLGGGPAGLEAALCLADQGQEVMLVEKNEELGGNPRFYNCKAEDECRRCGACMVAERVYRAKQHPLIQILTGSRLISARLEGRSFIIRCQRDGFLVPPGATPAGEMEARVEGIILATGFEPFDPALRTEMGYLKNERVVTAGEMEIILQHADEDRWEELLGVMPRIAIVRCFGSREQSRGVAYCSRVCCLYSERLGQILIDKIPGASVDIFFMDSQRYHPVYGAGDQGRIRYIRGMPARIFQDHAANLILRYEDTGRSQTSQNSYDWVVLCPAMLPAREGSGVAEMLGVDRDERGFVVGANGLTNKRGVFAAGCCTGPKTILESLGSGQTAAGQLLKHLTSA